jgi:hypothetical protein
MKKDQHPSVPPFTTAGRGRGQYHAQPGAYQYPATPHSFYFFAMMILNFIRLDKSAD